MASSSRPAPPALVNPYRNVAPAARVRGSTLELLGLVAGVIAVAAPPVGDAVAGDTQIWFGSAQTVARELTQHDATSGYLWPAPTTPAASPALDL
jgi:hypothetical protein